jgi:hypothetical protein
MNDEVISEKEFNDLVSANERITKEFKKQIDKKKDWNWETGSTSHSAKKGLPSGLLDAMKAFDVKEETTFTKGEYPYYRVLSNVPHPIDIPDEYR